MSAHVLFLKRMAEPPIAILKSKPALLCDRCANAEVAMRLHQTGEMQKHRNNSVR